MKPTFSSRIFFLNSKGTRLKRIRTTQGKLPFHLLNSVSKLYSNSKNDNSDKNQNQIHNQMTFPRCVTSQNSISNNYFQNHKNILKLNLAEIKSPMSTLTIDANNKIKSKWRNLRKSANISNTLLFSSQTQSEDEENKKILTEEQFRNINNRIQRLDLKPSPILTLSPKTVVQIDLLPNTIMFFNIFCNNKLSPLKAKFKVDKGKKVKIYASNTTQRPNKSNFINVFEGIDNYKEILILCGQKMFTKFQKNQIFISFESPENVKMKAIFGFGNDNLFFPAKQIQATKTEIKTQLNSDRKKEVVNNLMSSTEIINKLKFYQNNPDDLLDFLSKIEQIQERRKLEKCRAYRLFGNYVEKNKMTLENLKNIITRRMEHNNNFDSKINLIYDRRINDEKLKLVKSTILSHKSELRKLIVLFIRKN